MNLNELTRNELQDEISDLKSSMEIPGHTCPHINYVLDNLKEANKIIKNNRRYSSVEEFSDAIEMALAGSSEELEIIRTANDRLRELGKTWYKFSISLTKYFEDLR
jgi:hypothetical protein